ncbi:MAG: LPS assembly protein LptD [Deltaproteobacteria bacterium]
MSMLALLLVLLLAAPPALAVDFLGDALSGRRNESEGIAVDADSIIFDQESGILEAKGDVVITNGETLLVADEIEINRATSEASARGRVVLEDASVRVRASRMVLNLDDETGILDEAEIYMPLTRFQMRGRWMAKGHGQTYRIRDGSLTTCQCDEGAPDWSITSGELDIDADGWGHIRDGVFRIKDVPVFYLPWAMVPVRKESQSGLLFPQFGLSNRRGFQYVQPFLWEINKSQDLKVTFDIQTSARIGLLGDYRYMLSPEAGGRLSVSYFNEHIRGDGEQDIVDPEELADPTIPENRWSVIGQHRQSGPWGSELYARPFLVSDSLFLREMNTLTNLPGRVLNLTTLRYTTSEIGGLKRLDNGFLKAEAVWFQDLIDEQARVPQPLPRITLNQQANFFGGRLRLGLNSQAVYYHRDEWASGGRIHLAPEVSVPYNIGSYGYGSLRVVLQETAYWLNDTELPIWPPVGGEYETRNVSSFQHRETVQVQANFNTELARVFDIQRGDLLKIKHVIQPYLAYNYSPTVHQADLPLWDYIDRVNYRNLITYGVSTRLLGKFSRGGPAALRVPPVGATEGDALLGDEGSGPPAAPEPAFSRPTEVRELARLYVQQSYSLRRPLIGTEDTRSAHFSGVDLGLRVSPVNWAALRSRAIVSVVDRKLLFAEVGAHLFDPRPRAGTEDTFLPGLRPVNSASLFYQFNSGGTLENINLGATYRFTDHLSASYLGRFDVTDGRFLENWGGMRLISFGDCWVIDVAFVDRVNPDEKEFRFQVSLVGLGSFGQSPFREFTSSFPTVVGSGAALGGMY